MRDFTLKYLEEVIELLKRRGTISDEACRHKDDHLKDVKLTPDA